MAVQNCSLGYLYTLIFFVFIQRGIGQKKEAVGMYSADGEYVEFGQTVLLEGPVEVLY